MATKPEDQTSSSILNLDELPKIEWGPNTPLIRYNGFWLFPWTIESLHYIQTQYNPLPDDVLLASFPKSGTTWLKAIAFSILHNHNTGDPLQTHNPHQLVPFLEVRTFGKNPDQKIDEILSPRIFNTHLPYSILPENVENSSCKIIYISRDPADVIVSGWHFYNKNYKASDPITLEEYFNDVMLGITLSGPLFEHVMEYWEARQEENMLLVTYEELKAYPNENVKRIAEFLGCSLSDDEVEQVVIKSSFERLSKLDVNTGEIGFSFTNASLKYSSFFRNGSVGDGEKCLTSEMKKRLSEIVNKKWRGSGLGSKLLGDRQVSSN